jgi:hypothetical protein
LPETRAIWRVKERSAWSKHGNLRAGRWVRVVRHSGVTTGGQFVRINVFGSKVLLFWNNTTDIIDLLDPAIKQTIAHHLQKANFDYFNSCN